MRRLTLIFGLVLGTAAAGSQACIETCDEYGCEAGQATITVRPARKSGSLAPGEYTWTVTTSDGEELTGSCEVDGMDSTCTGGGILAFRDGEVVMWQLTVRAEVDPGELEPASAEVLIMQDAEVIYDGTHVFDYAPRDDCHPECIDATLAIEV